MTREIKYSQAINEALDQCLAADPSVYIIGLGVPDPAGTFGTTLGLQEKYGPKRVMDMPTSENAMTGIVLGSSLTGMRPVLSHQRVDFALLSLEQIVNQAAKWHYMYGGRQSAPLVIRMVIGRGWGQGPQHSQSLQSWFGHVPGLKVMMPTTPHDAKGMLIAAIEDDNPVIFLEHRWLHGIAGEVPEDMYRVPAGSARIAREGTDISLISTSYMTLEALSAADMLAQQGISAEVIDVRSIAPVDWPTILASARKTGRVLATDTGWKTLGFAAEVIARVAEEAFDALATAPRRVCLPDYPTPTSPALAAAYYPRAVHIVAGALEMLGRKVPGGLLDVPAGMVLDQPDPGFTGPF